MAFVRQDFGDWGGSDFDLNRIRYTFAVHNVRVGFGGESSYPIILLCKGEKSFCVSDCFYKK